jgi:hypothetical protein
MPFVQMSLSLALGSPNVLLDNLPTFYILLQTMFGILEISLTKNHMFSLIWGH